VGSSAARARAFAPDLPLEPTLTSFTGGSAPGGGLSFQSLGRGAAQSFCASRVLRHASGGSVIEIAQPLRYGCLTVRQYLCVLVKRSGSGLLASNVRAARGGSALGEVAPLYI
jgi:hypothetical protein